MTTLNKKAVSAKVTNVNVNETEWVIKGTCTSLPAEITYRKIKKYSTAKVVHSGNADHQFAVDTIEWNVVKPKKDKAGKVSFVCRIPLESLYLHKVTPHINNWEIYVILSDGREETEAEARLLAPAADKLYMEKLYYGDRAFLKAYKTPKGYLNITRREAWNEDTLKDMPVKVVDIERSGDTYRITGMGNRKILSDVPAPSSSGILLKKRGRVLNKSLKVNWLNDYFWQADWVSSEPSFSGGLWDAHFYIKTDKRRLYRIDIDTKEFLRGAYHRAVVDGGIRRIRPYRTSNGGFSFKVFTDLVNVFAWKSVYQNNKVHMSGSFQWGKYEVDAFHLCLFDKQTSEVVRTPMDTAKGNLQKKEYTFTCSLPEKSLFFGGNKEASRYEVYLSAEVDARLMEYRFKIRPKVLEAEPRKEWRRGDHVYKGFFYTTVNNRLAYMLKEAGIVRDIAEFSINDNSFYIEGTASFNAKEASAPDEQTLAIIARSRETEQEVLFVPYEKKDDAFKAELPLDKLKTIHNDRDTIDLYIRVELGGYTRERKLGRESFTYYKDHILASHSLKTEKNVLEYYAVYTPRGNIKIETALLSKKHAAWLKEKNETYTRSTESYTWIIGERPDTAQDTGYHFFKYCRLHHPEIDAYYVIEEGAEDYEKVIPLGNVLTAGSDEHVIKTLEADAFFGSHDIEYLLPFKGALMVSYQKAAKVFLQHGVLGRKKVEYDKKYYHYPFDIFCVSSEMEKQMVVEKMGYSPGEVKVTGLSRFDELLESPAPKRKILLMPTWREWLHNEETFLESTYYKKYRSLIHNEELHKMLDDYDVDLDFYPHYRMQPYVEHFTVDNSSHIRVVKLGEVSVQELLKEGSLMITDYSSVSFDFSYMGKPVIFYHFDAKSFFKTGSLRPRAETFLGDTVKSEHNLINSIRGHIEQSFQEKKSVSEKKSSIFTHIDQNNAERIYQEALDALNNSN
ncbi:CDP-glycerol glycerophosphotransferase (TagB/SpsB family) [Sinobaca qinghaiensis]|uniref:CDP-glycerol glycerophosphotransferase (TagB/SpsB family) n=1 Tax=Sinobaca qinghaiensis TaxID=342944 RepID=A0A419UZR3_9BACL|nr:CDP-glycerol glycerophosphotransferase family protein [Sinobaca qinghaiensis]RKD71172.1 CDP-glycerol glycerophosphotransferase (TagB/SpsB family) [Sinobaca qinghaiensis]